MDLQVNTYHVTAFQPISWRIGRIYRKNSFLYCCVLDRVYRAVAYNALMRSVKILSNAQIRLSYNSFATGSFQWKSSTLAPFYKN
jgi:hypothetical protein